jgi:hypothetical protein
MSGGAQRMAARVEGRMARTANSIGAAFAGVGKSMAAGLVAGGVAGILGGIVTGVRSATSAIADMKAAAETAGVSFLAFQELQFAAEQSKVGVDALTDGFKEMSLRADEFIDTGKGSGAEAFAQLGFRAADLAEQLKEPDRLFEEIIDRLSQLDKASQIRIADEIFGGTGGEQFVRFLEDGRRGIEAMRDRFHEVGKVISDDVAAEAEALDQRFNEIATTLSTNMKSGVVTFADAAVAAFDRATAAVDRYQRALNAADGGTAMGEMAGGPRARLARDLEAQANGTYDGPAGFSRVDMDMSTDKTGRVEPSGPRTFTPYTLPSSGSGSGGSSAISEAERQEEATRKVIESLQDEVLMLGMSERAQRVYSEAKRAGVEVGSDEYQQIQQLVGAYHDKTEAMDRAAEMQRAFSDLALDGFYELTSAINTGNEALDGMLSRLIDMAAQAVFLGKGPLASLFKGGLGGLGGGGDPWAGMRSTGGGGIGSLISSGIGMLGGLFGFKDGGITGVYHLEIAGALK